MPTWVNDRHRAAESYFPRGRLCWRVAAKGVAMQTYTVIPTTGLHEPAEVTAIDAGSVLGVVGRVGFEEADVLQLGKYLFSLSIDSHGVWKVFDRRRSYKTQRNLTWTG